MKRKKAGRAVAKKRKPGFKPAKMLAHSVPLRRMQKRLFFEPAVYYACTGNCLGLVTKEAHGRGHTSCRIIVCSNYGKPLKKMHYCRSCRTHYEPHKKHHCPGR
ncbi:MAG: hypothetical protein WCX64_01740 [Candidatus Micrarchaeia archaeon]|jgi:hypothetical protein